MNAEAWSLRSDGFLADTRARAKRRWLCRGRRIRWHRRLPVAGRRERHSIEIQLISATPLEIVDDGEMKRGRQPICDYRVFFCSLTYPGQTGFIHRTSIAFPRRLLRAACHFSLATGNFRRLGTPENGAKPVKCTESYCRLSAGE